MLLSQYQLDSIRYSINTYLRLQADLSLPAYSSWLQYSFYILAYDEDDNTYMYQDKVTHEWLPISHEEVEAIKTLFLNQLEKQKNKFINYKQKLNIG